MTLALTLVLGAVALTALFWGLAAVLQPYLYGQPADQLPLRAAVAGLAVAAFMTAWTYANTHASHKDKYGTLFEFTPAATADVNEFDAVRRIGTTDGRAVKWVTDEKGEPKEVTTRYKWQAERGGGRFIDPGTNKEFRLNDASSVTVALVVPDGEAKPRFDAPLKDGVYATKDGERRFDEQGGTRSIDGRNPRIMLVPSASAFAIALFFNVGHFVVWFLAFWLGLRYTTGPALLLVAILGSAAMLVLMPLLFQLNAVPPAAPVAPAPPPATAPAA